ncbi:MAG: hypothetical protein AUJ52_12440 [Elusimicrobia bacterium CG1_02_63_36]|nr:MAG: hypothetical protein AUJ52_12440 [Elusimicrobia bacterium CG1_02_63_36]PIP83002.1 MAG: hypothetical protein COR54_11895 [Elusimicrobia bacterium CG22_combo_CG10-13_8_21_14_all_63_91]PJA17495.1 MAG: hypothetical protein COX66_04425 [Elusimicrobia bacterium CG_4_10_14_0_2_um_filter_63_34]PJB25433.1 MAG: hypothetical protein CO113_08535 [Elusimicrobia bacterium CG_4_9_14_3_um_filter_62_55]
MKVPFSYLERQFAVSGPGESPTLTDTIFEDLKRFVVSGDFTLGKSLVEFERKFAAHEGAKHALGVNSGTDALFLSLKGLGVGPGDEVITCAETFIATAGSIAQSGATPVFVDVNDEFTIDADRIEAAITPKTKAIMPVWFTGNAPDMDRILEIANAKGLKVIEDSCCAIDGAYKNRKAGSIGDAGGFSFHPLKNLNVWSDGGMITTNSDELAAKIALLRNHGFKSRDEVEIFGYNSRMDTFQAVVALRMIDDVAAVTDRRIAAARRYDDALRDLEGLIDIPRRSAHIRHVYHLYMLRVKDRDGLLRHLQENGVEAKIHYPIPLPYQKACAHLGCKKGDFPKTERDCDSIVTLPSHAYLTEDEISYAIETLRGFYGK